VILLGTAPFVAQRLRAQSEAGPAAAAAGKNSSGSAPATGAGSVVRTVASVDRPAAMAADALGHLFVVSNDRVYRVTLAAMAGSSPRGALEAVAGNGEWGSLGDGGPAIDAQLNLETARVDAGAAGKLTPAEIARTAAGGWARPGGFGGVSIVGSGVAVDPAGNIFIGDVGNETVRRVDAESGIISSVAGKWATGAAGANALTGLAGLATDANGNLFFVAANTIYRLDANGGALTALGNVAGAASIAVARDGGTVYVASVANRAIYALALGTVGAGTGVAASEPRLVASLEGWAPTGIAVDPSGSGTLYVSEGKRNIILRIDPATASLPEGRATVIAGTGVLGHTGDGGAPLAAEFAVPGALALDGDGNLFVVENGNAGGCGRSGGCEGGSIREITDIAHVAAGVTLAPNTFAFPTQLTGGSTAPQPFTLTNNSNATVTGINVTFAGAATPPDFTQTNTCGTQLAAGASCTIDVVFAPQASGTRSAALHVADSDASSPQTASLSGVGDDFEMAVQPAGTQLETILAGNTATFLLQATPDDVFSGTVTLSCPINLPKQTTCTLTPATLALTAGGAAQTFSMKLVTTVRQLSKGPQPTMVAPGGGAISSGGEPHTWINEERGAGRGLLGAARMSPPGAAEMAALCAMMLLIATAMAWRARKFSWVAGLAILALLAVAPSCGSNNNSSIIGTIYTGTPAGTYHLLVTGTAQNTTRAVSITLVVQ
jgi:sugar lactone lactonase YvrE